jgi:hypothetical protein
MAEGSRTHRTSDAFLAEYEERKSERCSAVLGYSELFRTSSSMLSGMGIQCGQSLLVYQRDHLLRKASKQLESQDEGLSEM